jgi:hypothetical protein
MHAVTPQKCQKAIVEWIDTHKPDLFLTINFCRPCTLSRTEYLLCATHRRILQKLLGKTWHKRKSEQPYFFAFIEQTASNNTHAHLLVRRPLTDLVDSNAYCDLWKEEGGRISHKIAQSYVTYKIAPHRLDVDVRQIWSLSGLLDYVTKKIVKGGDQFAFCVSPNVPAPLASISCPQNISVSSTPLLIETASRRSRF